MRLIEQMPARLRANPEFQSALVRIGIWLFALCYIGYGAWSGVFQVRYPAFFVLFLSYLVLNISILLSVLRRPEWEARRYLALSFDIIAVSLAIYLVGNGFSPFYLVYIWIFVSAGTRYGRRHLQVASLAAVLSYNLVLLVLGEWREEPLNALFHTLVLVLLPLYQASLLNKLREATTAAERASAAKGVFLANMTHELRTPLTGVRGMAHLLLGTRLDVEQRQYARDIIAAADTLHALIGDILDLSKIEARKLVLEAVAFDPRGPVREVCNALQLQAVDKGLDLICDVSPTVPAQVLGDPLKVRQILFNLLGNAIKFTERGEVVVRLLPVAGSPTLPRPHLLLQVADTGIGIAPDKLQAIFESFQQADDSTTRRYGGTGLGTTIARELVVQMGGAIEVQSTEGVGSCFAVRLPLPPAPADAAGPDVAPAAAPDLAGRRVLICESNATQRRLIADTCTALGATCRALTDCAALDGAAAGASTGAWAGPPPDLLIVADHPAGSDLAATLRDLGERLGREPPLLCLTYRQRQALLAASGRCCLDKPFLREDLAAAIARTLAPPAPGTGTGTGDGDGACERVADGPSAAGTRVLVAEDNAIAARVITGLLARQGAQPTRCDNGVAALAAAQTGGFDVAFVDLRMPGLDGIGFVRALREHEQTHGGHLPVFALTANACEDVRIDCLAAGMDGFLSKPINPDALAETVARFRPGGLAIGADAASTD